MAECFITRRGGTGAGLNFKIVNGLSRPVSPKENMIWIKTAKSIPEWFFGTDAEKPLTSKEGGVFIVTDDISDASVNILKKNSIMVMLCKAYIYEGGKWNPVSANVYVGGSWVDLAKVSIIKAGDIKNVKFYGHDDFKPVGKVGNSAKFSSISNGYAYFATGPLKLEGYKTATITFTAGGRSFRDKNCPVVGICNGDAMPSGDGGVSNSIKRQTITDATITKGGVISLNLEDIGKPANLYLTIAGSSSFTKKSGYCFISDIILVRK